jgi:hypothetical protein
MEEALKRIEHNSKLVGYWIVKVGLAVAEIAIAYMLVRLTQGTFQTTVVCLLGLTYERVKFSSLDQRAVGEMLGFLISRSAYFVKNQSDTSEQFERSIDEQGGRMKTVESTLMTVEDWILKVIFVWPLLKLCLTAVG